MTDAQLQAFVAVADHGSFTAAGRELGMSQSAVSKAVTALEEVLRVTLLVRSARGIQLTEVGETMMVRAREVLRLKASMRDEAEAARRLRRGSVRVGSFGTTSSRRLLPPILQAFARGYPEIAVSVVEGSDPEVELWLREGKLDVGFVTLPNEEFDTFRIARDELAVLLPAAHPLAAEDRITPRQLASLSFIMSTGGCEPAVQQILREASPEVRYHIREVHTLVELVQQGAGVAVKPMLSLPDPLPPGVVCRPLDPPRMREIGLAVPRERDTSPACRAFLRVAGVRRGVSA
ncbi:MAG TPA: LysR family transcriptional regulator [Longimicrobium sp.]|nr:LysR family transcriptional regulator [Longimicrobium sp.]